MGNCHASEAAMVVIQHPDHKVVQRMYWSVSANVVMSSNPGYYVAHVIFCNNDHVSPSTTTTSSMAVKQLKLLRPDDSLVLGQVYRLISFEDVLKGFAGNKNKRQSSSAVQSPNLVKYEMLNRAVMRRHNGGGQWRPVLQSIAELGTTA